jgi:hypothetical protein
MNPTEQHQEILEKVNAAQKDEALKLFRERWWDRLSKTFLYRLLHGFMYGRAGEITIVMRKDDKISLRPWLSKRANRNQAAAFQDIFNYIYYMRDNMVIVEQFMRDQIVVRNMIEDYRNKYGSNPVLDDIFKTHTLQ